MQAFMAGQKAPEPDQVQADKLVQVVEERDMTKGTDSQYSEIWYQLRGNGKDIYNYT